jgi:hypothetical protein
MLRWLLETATLGAKSTLQSGPISAIYALQRASNWALERRGPGHGVHNVLVRNIWQV